MMSDDASSQGNSIINEKDYKHDGEGKGEENKQSNTIMQQINNFAKIPMNDTIGNQTIEEHKYLLENVENKCAIAFFACLNRNLSLYNALVKYLNVLELEDEAY